MNAPSWEEALRIALAVVSTAAGIALTTDWRRSRALSISPLMAYMAGTVLAYAVWRWVIVVIGLTMDAGSDYARTIEPYVRSTGNVLLLLVFMALLFTAWVHVRARRE